jgi:hypothetical protein
MGKTSEVQTTTIAVGEVQVTIETSDVASGVPAKNLRATVGDVVCESRVTFGAMDGPRLEVTAEQLQADLDNARQKLAEEAAWQAELRTLVSQLG